ncbi:MAG: hypothetical protein ACAI37_24515, partial [Chthoniobacter sp.]
MKGYHEVHFTAADWKTLRDLRERFLAGTAGTADYWQSPEHLELYDSFYAERIGWKWDAVIGELVTRGWRPRARNVCDFGCGSGVAGRRMLGAWPGFES